MTIFWAGGEDISGIVLGSVTWRSSGSAYARSAFTRTAINTGVASTSWPSTSSFSSPVLSNLTSGWYHGRCSTLQTGGNSTLANAIFMALSDSSGVARILIRGTGSSGQLKITTRNAAGTLTDLVTSALNAMPYSASGAPSAIDLFVNYAVAGRATLYIDGVSVADTGASVNVTTDSATSLAQVTYGGLLTSNGVDWSEFCVSDTSTLGTSVLTLPPVAAGNTQSWTPSTVANVNPTTLVDANFVSASTANSLSEWTVSTTLPSGNWSITAYSQDARVQVGTSGPQHFAWLLRTSDGSDNVSGSLAPSTSFGNFHTVWSTNPHTGVAWNSTELINAGIESLA